MRKGDSHLELLIYLAPILQRQSPGGVPCRGRHRAPWPAVLPRFWPWQRSPLCCLTRNSPGYYQVCDLSMCGSLTRRSITLCLGRGWNTPVYPLIVCPSVGREGGAGGWKAGDTWTGGAWQPRNQTWELFAGQEKQKHTHTHTHTHTLKTTCSLWVGQKAVIRYLSVNGAGTPAALWCHHHICICITSISSAEAQQTSSSSPSKCWYNIFFDSRRNRCQPIPDQRWK